MSLRKRHKNDIVPEVNMTDDTMDGIAEGTGNREGGEFKFFAI
jgi:hypothetical protein